MSQTCGICANNTGNCEYACSEKMFGLGDEFNYIHCAACGCLQAIAPPPNLDRFYYPSNYYSFQGQPVRQQGLVPRLRGYIDMTIMTSPSPVGTWLRKLNDPVEPRGLASKLALLFELNSWTGPESGYWPSKLFLIHTAIQLKSLARLGLNRETQILDVGCGGGWLLGKLYRAGFHRLAGIDPLLPNDVEIVPNLVVRRLDLEEIHEQFDLIMLHHVLEHIDRPLEMLVSCRQRLKAGGTVMVRTPLVESYAWEKYRQNWVQLDAPRHLFLHSRASLELLAQQSGLMVTDIWCDSTAFQFWGSELYLKGISLVDEQGNQRNPVAYLSRSVLKGFIQEAWRLNSQGRGDQCVVLLTHATQK